ncbi:MAG: YlmH/Sll1252 family protein [Vallitaleaceae bacterium]|jgi:RNA-binding protein YlmH|nr:YlmH/Sll1252 family protein [Vallitaleaceae bacterium]
MDKATHILIERIKDMLLTAEYRQQVSSTNFLDLNQLSVVSGVIKTSSVKYFYYGGYPLAERKCLILLPPYRDSDDIDDEVWQRNFGTSDDNPLTTILITHEAKFQTKPLTHRDYLGALINLGIDRQVIGDIIVENDSAYVFVVKHIATFILESLIKVNRYNVHTEIADIEDIDVTEPAFKIVTGTVQSIRIDSMLTCAFHLSRTASTEYIASGKVFKNNLLIIKNNTSLVTGDLITLRGLGRCKLTSIGTQTKKNRYHVTFHVYQ